MPEEEFIALATTHGLCVEKIRGGYTIDLEGTEHSIRSAMLTDYGLRTSHKGWMDQWLAQSRMTMELQD